MPKQAPWTKKEEKLLEKFIVENKMNEGHVDWYGVTEYLPQPKYFRMKNDEGQRWDFESKLNSRPKQSQLDDLLQEVHDLLNKIDLQ